MSDFEKAAEKVKNLKSKPTDQELLELYGLYKQATVGNCNTERPGIFDIKGKAKWDVWKSKEGLNKDEAKAKYIDLVENLISTYGLN